MTVSYYITTGFGKRTRRWLVEGALVKIGGETFGIRRSDSGNWVITELVTGLTLASAGKRAEAIEEGKRRLRGWIVEPHGSLEKFINQGALADVRVENIPDGEADDE